MEMSEEVLDFIARNLVDNPDDMGKVIGKRGRTAKAIRTMVKAAATREGVNASVEIVE